MGLPAGFSVPDHVPVRHGGRNAVRGAGSGVADFSSNINPLGCHASVLRAMRRSLGRVHEYPDPSSEGLVRELARYTGLGRANLAVGNGAVEILYNFASMFLPKRRVLIPAPTFQEYEAASSLNRCRTEFFETASLADDIGRFVARIPRRGCVFVCNPNNPTGSLVSRGDVLRIVRAAAERSSLAFVDECFIELVPDSDQSVISSVKRHGNLLVLRSLTKSFGLPGIRVGYAAGHAGLVSALNRTRIPWSVNSVAQDAGAEALRHPGHLARANRLIRAEYAFRRDRINRIDGMRCLDSATNFVLIESGMRSATLQRRLLGRGVLVRDCAGFRGLSDRFVRAAVRTRPENLRLVRALEAV